MLSEIMPLRVNIFSSMQFNILMYKISKSNIQHFILNLCKVRKNSRLTMIHNSIHSVFIIWLLNNISAYSSSSNIDQLINQTQQRIFLSKLSQF